ncbi:MAG: DUF4910 domain-containing protein [Erysipelotrichaceae bacterium]
MEKVIQEIKNSIQTKRLYDGVKCVSSHHRIQASTGYRNAANYCLKEFEKSKIDAKILSYDANGSVWNLTSKVFQEWSCEEAYLELVDTHERIADYISEPISIIQRSYPYDFSNGVEMVYLDQGTNFEAYKDLDVEGKIVFARGHFSEYQDWAIRKNKAIGIVSDHVATMTGVRSRYDLYKSLTYTSFWWTHTDLDTPCFGFVLSPEKGDELALKFKDKKTLLCKGKVVSSLYDGKMEVVEAKIPGTSDEEVLICAHLCHPKASCNDNASGVSAAIETLRVLKQLTDEKKIESLKRTVKVILVPEFTGTYAYLEDPENYKHCAGAINLDMVGGKQTRQYGPITLTALPRSTPSFIEDLSKLCLALAGQEAPTHEGTLVAKTNYAVSVFSGGSDHTLFSDPTIGVPCCMLGQWPDLNYHTSTDDMSVIDPEVLAFSTRVATYFSYLLSNFDDETATKVLANMQVSVASQLAEVTHGLNACKITKNAAYKEVCQIKQFYEGSIDSVAKMGNAETTCQAMQTWLSSTVQNTMALLSLEEKKSAGEDQRVFKREFIAPLMRLNDYVASHRECEEAVKEFEEKIKTVNVENFYNVQTLMCNYIDGIRTVDQIVEAVTADTRIVDKMAVIHYIHMLEAIKLIKLT